MKTVPVRNLVKKKKVYERCEPWHWSRGEMHLTVTTYEITLTPPPTPHASSHTLKPFPPHPYTLPANQFVLREFMQKS
ncbi:hypothetical protein E2C01_062880 [Portunus trituberculatus]|uniref:Uncharacterized protein n=1 Tax=Portunus trituberculatus TaxID=210409 RepID=A0A5B7HF97_PORTR|nr:hypothetical protein [Portunus trituberculatus]